VSEEQTENKKRGKVSQEGISNREMKGKLNTRQFSKRASSKEEKKEDH